MILLQQLAIRRLPSLLQLLIFASLFLLNSRCSDDSPPPLPPPPCLVIKIVDDFTGANPDLSYLSVTTFTYDNTYRLVKNTTAFTNTSGSTTTVTDYNYVDGKIASAIRTPGSSTATWTYDNFGVTKIVDPAVTSEFTYNSRGVIATWKSTIGATVKNTVFTIGTSGLLTRSALGTLVTEYGNFDTATNPYFLLANSMNLPFFVNSNQAVEDRYLSLNNPNIADVGNNGTPVNHYDYTYEYYKTLPTKITRTQSDGKLVTTVQYQNCE